MGSPRRIYKQGEQAVLSHPFYLMRDLGATANDYFLLRPISHDSLIFELVKSLEVEARGFEHFRNIPFSALRSLYRQSNCLVHSIPKPMLAQLNAEIGDTIIVQWLNQGTLTGTVVKAALKEYQDARNFNQFRQPNKPTRPG
jgi:antitoxin component of MazEF toxin-antitoxin module